MDYGFNLQLPDWVPSYLAEVPDTIDSSALQMALAIDLSAKNVAMKTGGPFGAAVFDKSSGRLLSVGVNVVVASGLSVAHAEVMALTLAQHATGKYDLGTAGDYILVTSAEPCVMCMGASLWSGVKEIIYGAPSKAVEASGFDEGPKPKDWVAQLVSRGIEVTGPLMQTEALAVLQRYQSENGQIYSPERDN